MRLNKAMEIADTLAKRVKFARTTLEMSQEMLAQKSGLKQADISKIETGRILRTTGIAALARALRADVDWLADGIGNMRPDGTRQLTPSAPVVVTAAQAIEAIARLLTPLTPIERMRVASLFQNMTTDPDGPWIGWLIDLLDSSHDKTTTPPMTAPSESTQTPSNPPRKTA